MPGIQDIWSGKQGSGVQGCDEQDKLSSYPRQLVCPVYGVWCALCTRRPVWEDKLYIGIQYNFQAPVTINCPSQCYSTLHI